MSNALESGDDIDRIKDNASGVPDKPGLGVDAKRCGLQAITEKGQILRPLNS